MGNATSSSGVAAAPNKPAISSLELFLFGKDRHGGELMTLDEAVKLMKQTNVPFYASMFREFANVLLRLQHVPGRVPFSEHEQNEILQHLDAAARSQVKALANPYQFRAIKVSILTRVVVAHLKLTWIDFQSIVNSQDKLSIQDTKKKASSLTLDDLYGGIMLLRMIFVELIQNCNCAQSSSMFALLGSSFASDFRQENDSEEHIQQLALSYGKFLSQALVDATVQFLHVTLVILACKDSSNYDHWHEEAHKSDEAGSPPSTMEAGLSFWFGYPIESLARVLSATLDFLLVMMSAELFTDYSSPTSGANSPSEGIVFVDSIRRRHTEVLLQQCLIHITIGRRLFAANHPHGSKVNPSELNFDISLGSSAHESSTATGLPPSYILESYQQESKSIKASSAFGYESLKSSLYFGRKSVSSNSSRLNLYGSVRVGGRWTPDIQRYKTSPFPYRNVSVLIEGFEPYLDNIRDQALLLFLALCVSRSPTDPHGKKTVANPSESLDFVAQPPVTQDIWQWSQYQSLQDTMETVEEYLWMDERGPIMFYMLLMRNSKFRRHVLNPENFAVVIQKIVLPTLRLLCCASIGNSESSGQSLEKRSSSRGSGTDNAYVGGHDSDSLPILSTLEKQQRAMNAANDPEPGGLSKFLRMSSRRLGQNTTNLSISTKMPNARISDSGLAGGIEGHEGAGLFSESSYVSHVILLLLTENADLAASLQAMTVKTEDILDLWQVDIQQLREESPAELPRAFTMSELVFMVACQSLFRFAGDSYLLQVCMAVASNVLSTMTSMSPISARVLVSLLTRVSHMYLRRSAREAAMQSEIGERQYSRKDSSNSSSTVVVSQELRCLGEVLGVAIESVASIVFRSQTSSTVVEKGRGVEKTCWDAPQRMALEVACLLMDHRDSLFDTDSGISVLIMRNRSASVSCRAAASRLSELLNRIELACDQMGSDEVALKKYKGVHEISWEYLDQDDRFQVLGSCLFHHDNQSEKEAYKNLVSDGLRFYYNEDRDPEAFFIPYCWGLVVNYSSDLDFDLNNSCWQELVTRK